MMHKREREVRVTRIELSYPALDNIDLSSIYDDHVVLHEFIPESTTLLLLGMAGCSLENDNHRLGNSLLFSCPRALNFYSWSIRYRLIS